MSSKPAKSPAVSGLPPSPTKASAPAIKNLFEASKQADSPSQSYFKVIVTSSEVVLSEWPRRRFSQKWSRDSAMNPTTNKASFAAFLDGELKDEIKAIFGSDTMVKIIDIVSGPISKKLSVKEPSSGDVIKKTASLIRPGKT